MIIINKNTAFYFARRYVVAMRFKYYVKNSTWNSEIQI